MRIILLIIGWFFAVVAALRTAVFGYGVWLAASDDAVGWDVTVETLLTDHVKFFAWTIDFGMTFLPSGWMDWALSQPALVLLPISAVIAALLAVLFFRLEGRSK